MRSLGELGALLVGILQCRDMLFPPEICTVVQIGTISEIFLWLPSFVIIAMAFSGFLSHVVPLAFTFICLFIYFDNPHFTEGICS